MNEYIQKWCDERHEKIEKEFEAVWAKMKTMEGRLWGIIVLLIANLIGIMAMLAK